MEDLLRLMIQQTDEFAVIFFDTHGRILWTSHAADRIFGIDPSEARGTDASRLFTPEEVARGLDRNEFETARAGTEAEDDRWMQRQDGSRFWATGVLTPIHDASGKLVAFGKILRDRTDLRELMDHVRSQCDSAE
ncbi:MAG TPA: PAS domain S-box protein, partial [Candidatus Polarisedimenticolia bacterium]|nr:PAS domain S-box protein [Candidatus Polarisedimenticolia bacterium]